MVQPKGPQSSTGKPDYVSKLEDSYGKSSQAGFGSAVFFEILQAGASLKQAALEKYKFFVGDLWERFGEEQWMTPWKEVYSRPAGVPHAIISELNNIKDNEAQNSIPMILDVVQDAEKARTALSMAFDDPKVIELSVYNLGDNGAMSGLLVAGLREQTREATFLVFLLD